MLQDGSVLGQTFPVAALAALSGETAEALEPRLRSLARREILVLDTDPRSPERGQYGFTQALIREVAYSTLSKKERRARHLAAARYFEALGDEEVTGVLATHYVDAYVAAPEGPEGETVAALARIALRAAAARASALGSHVQAIAYLKRALEATPDLGEASELKERIGDEQIQSGRIREGIETLRALVDDDRARGDRSGELRATVLLASALNTEYRATEALAVLEPISGTLSWASEDDVVQLHAEMARAYMFNEESALAIEWSDRTLVVAERRGLIPEMASALITKGISLANVGRVREGLGLLETGERLAESAGLAQIVIRAKINRAGLLPAIDPRAGVEVARVGYDQARRLGLRHAAVIIAGNGAEAALPTGEWAWPLRAIHDLLEGELDPTDRVAVLGVAIELRTIVGIDVEPDLADMTQLIETRGVVGQEPTIGLAGIWVAYAAEKLETAVDEAMHVAAISSLNAPYALSVAGRVAVRLGDAGRVRLAVDRLVQTGIRGPTVDVWRRCAEAGLAALEGRWSDSVPIYQDATRVMRDLGLEFDLALAWLELLSVAPSGDPLAAAGEREAREILERLGARPFVEQLDRLIARRSAGTLTPDVARAPGSTAAGVSPG